MGTTLSALGPLVRGATTMQRLLLTLIVVSVSAWAQPSPQPTKATTATKDAGSQSAATAAKDTGSQSTQSTLLLFIQTGASLISVLVAVWLTATLANRNNRQANEANRKHDLA
jgi:hypothetical protein